jgi:hypothetical protein
LESWWSPLLFGIRPLSQISERTASYFNLLIVACSQGRMNVVTGFSLFGGDAVGSSIVTHIGLPKAMDLLIILQAAIESSL